MNNKILVTVIVPMIEQKYDIYIPVSKNVNVTLQLLSKTINELSEDHFPIKDNYTLLSSTGTFYDKAKTIKENGIKNGDTIILI